jgi:hypothetical protein
MAKPSADLIIALRATALRLRDGAPYAWSKMGRCNCGHLAQTLTRLTAKQIQQRALQRPGDWTRQAVAYCPGSGLPLDDVFATMMEIGLTRDDIGHLEHLSDPAVLARVRPGRLPLHHTVRDDVVAYLEAWAGLLEEALLPTLPLLRAENRRLSTAG